VKKLLVLLALCMALSVVLVACDTNEQPMDETTAGTTEAPTTEAPTTEEPTTEETTNEETTGEDGGLLGNHIENGYENTVLGFGITLEDGWYFFNTNETASLGGKTEETFTEENVKASLVGNQVAYLLYAMKDGGVQNMNIVIQNGSELGFELTADNYIQNMFEPLAQTLAAVGCNNLEKEIANVSFAGREVPAMIFSADMNGAPLHEVVLPIIYENYVALLTICTTNTDGCADILAAFYPVSSAQ
jgi:hypothetical protein